MPRQEKNLVENGRKIQCLRKKKKERRVIRSCRCGEPTICKEIQTILRRYDPNDHRLGYVKVCKLQKYTPPINPRRHDKLKVAAELLGLEGVDLFSSEKMAARRRHVGL